MEDPNNLTRRYKSDSIWLHDLPENLDDIAHLKGLILHHADRLKELPENIGILTNLTNLLMCASRLTNLENIGKLTNLTSLDLYDNRSLLSLPESIVHISKRMFGKYKQAPVEKKLPRIVRLDKIQNLDSHRGSHDSSLHHRINIRTV